MAALPEIMHHPGIHGWRWVRTSWLVTVGAFCFTVISANAAEPAWWTKQKKDLGLPPGLAYNDWDGKPGSTARSPAVSAQNQAALAVAGQIGSYIGSEIHKQLFGDPVRDAQLAAEAQERALAAQRAAELAAAEAEQKKQEDFTRLRGSLKLDSFDGDAGGGLVLKGVDVGSSGLGLKLDDSDDRPAPKARAAANELGLKLGDDDLRPQGTVAVANTTPVNLTLPNTDPMVVDARNVPSGLWQGMDSAIATAYSDAPPGVSDRVRKGFQAVMDRDWKVAKAWFEDALNRDPDNAGLKRLVALTQPPQPPPMPQAIPVEVASSNSPKTPGISPVTSIQLPNPKDIELIFPGLRPMEDKELMDILFGLDGSSPPQKPADPKPAYDFSLPLPPKAAQKIDWKAFFNSLKATPNSGRAAVSSVRG